MRRVTVALGGAAVVALQVWLTLYAQVVLAWEASLVLVALLGVGLRAYARHRRAAQRSARTRWPDARGIPVPQPAPLVGGPVLPPVDAGTGAGPVAALLDDRGDPLDDPFGARSPRPLV